MASIPAHRAKFGQLLAKIRKSRGFDTAYAFFHKNGGEDRFGFLYNHYLLIEKGRRLPSSESFKLILKTLMATPQMADDGMLLMRTYLKALLDGDSFYDTVIDPRTTNHDPSDPNSALLKQTAVKRVAEVPRLNKKQSDLLYSSREAFWIHQWLYQTGQKRSATELEKSLKIPLAALEPVLARMKELELIDYARGKYSSPFFRSGVFSNATASVDQQLAYNEFITKMIVENGEITQYIRLIFALDDPGQLANFAGMLREVTNKIFLYRPTTPVENGVLGSVEVRVSKLLEID